MAGDWDEMVLVGRVARAHGNRGQVIVDPATDFPEERFRPGSVLLTQRGGSIDTLTVESVRFHRGRPIIGLAGVTTMDAAEALAGSELRIDADALQPLPPGTFYRHDLIGCSVETPRGNSIGVVTGVEGDGAGSRLIVQIGGEDVLIPLADGICLEVDTARRKIVVEPPDGLLDLNITKRRSNAF